jgi:hypothetical protein
MVKRVVLGAVVVLLVACGAGVAVAQSRPSLSAHGPTAVTGTDATAVFRVGDRTVRQVRYQDRGTLVYSFVLANEGRLPVRVTGLGPLHPEPRLFRYSGLVDAHGNTDFTIPAGERRTVRLRMLMVSCETLSARAGSFATDVNVETSRAGVLEDEVVLDLPEEVHTGSPREAFCPRATASSRPPG